MIEFKNVSYYYKSPSASLEALCGVSASIRRGEITAIIGHTGSGKSTFMELAAGISEPRQGTVTLDEKNITACKKSIGIVFQYPEYQLFADTVKADIAFGPSNHGIKGSALNRRVEYAAAMTGLSEAVLNASPFELSGGQKRMAAIAGVIALKPEILLLDEPAAGLDPDGRKLIFSIMRNLLAENNNMIISFVTHSMEDAAENADRIILLDHGCVAGAGSPAEIFSQKELIRSCGLELPEAALIIEELRSLGADVSNATTEDEAFSSIIDYIERNRIKKDAP